MSFCLSLFAAQNLNLNDDEKTFLKSHPKIHCISTNTWAPFNTSTQYSQLTGIAVDFWEIIVQKAGIKDGSCQIIGAFSDVLFQIKNKKADLTISTSVTPERLKYAAFSKPYATFPIVIVTQDDVGFITDTKELTGKRVAVGKGFTSTNYLKKVYDGIEYVEVKNMDEALLMLAGGEVFAAVDVLPVMAYLIKKRGYNNLKISGKTEFNFDIRFMVRDDFPQLVSIIDKGIDSILPAEREAIFDKWFNVKYHSEEVNYELIIEIAVVLILAFGFIIFRASTLKNHNKKLNGLLRELEDKNQLLKELSVTDKLTGLFNRTKLDEVLNDNLQMYERYDNSFSVIILDIDFFKKINDNFGHHIGDEVLKDFAKILQSNVRNTDFIGRWGGEEFLIICPETDSAGAVRLANLLREKIYSHDFEAVGRVSASFGVAQVDVGDSSKDLLNKADWAMYSAKAEGKNRVVCSL